MKRIIALLLIAVLCLSLVACGGGSQNDDADKEMQIVGTWKMGNMTHIFNEDHTGTIMQGSGITMACDWSYKNGEYTIGYAMGENTATITENEDGTLVLHYNGGEYTLAEGE